jgi:hypothetical protein
MRRRRAAEIRVSIDRLKNRKSCADAADAKNPTINDGDGFFHGGGHFELPLGAKSSVSSVSKTGILNGSQWVKR